MPFKRPTLPQLAERIIADIESRLPGSDAHLRRNLLNVLARAQAGAAHGLHGNLEWTAAQILPDTAEAEVLARHASIWGVRRKAAARAAGTVALTGNDGAVIPAGTLLQRSDGAEFATEADAVIAAGSAVATVAAVLAGSAGDTAAASALQLASPLAGVEPQATVVALDGGVEDEDDEDLRGRLLARIQAPPHGGRADDYTLWALEVPGVTRAWVYAHYLGVGTVGVIIANDDAESIIPDSQTVQAAQDYIDALRPVTAQVLVLAPVAVPLDMTIAVTPDTAAVRQAVADELTDFLRREATPGGTVYLSRLREAISVAEGETSHQLLAPLADVAHATGELAILGVITWA